VTDSDDAVPPLVRRFRTVAADGHALAARCAAGHAAHGARGVLAELDRLDDPDEWDRYGDRGPVAVVEAKVAELLAKPAAVFLPQRDDGAAVDVARVV
jgi:hypothetical protein